MASDQPSKLRRAVKMAEKLHRGQNRDGEFPLPYLTHPLDVATKLRYLAGVTEEDQLCAAVLHDTVEEGGAELKKIEKRFGKVVRGLVEELTRREPTAEEVQGLTPEQVWELRNGWLLDEIKAMSTEAKRIKLADRLSNLAEGLKTRSGDRLARYIQQTFLILEVVPREVSPELWDAIREMLG